MMRVHLVPEGLPTLQWTTVSGVHRQLDQLPVVHMILFYNNWAQALHILKVEELPFPVLGHGAPCLRELIRTAIQGARR